MQRFASVLLVAVAVAATPAVRASEVSPIGKVVQLISDLQGKVIKEGEEAQKLYAEFSEWCEDRARELGHEIKTGTAEADSLKASIATSSASILEFTSKIDDLASDIATDEADLKAATEIRDNEAADFKAEESELVETISMLDRATGILEREMAKGGSSMMQVKNAQSLASALSAMVQASVMSSADAQRLTALVQTSNTAADTDAESDVGAPDATVYESQSGNVVQTLHDMMEKAESQLDSARKTETKNLQNFEMLKLSLSDEIKFANKDMAAAKSGLAQSSEAKAIAEGDLETTSKDLQADIEAKADLHQECMSKAEDFESETKSRAEELQAIAKAKQIIIEATGGAESISYGGASFVQTAAHSRLSSKADLAGFEVVRMVRDLARKHSSQGLMLLAQRMSSAAHSQSVDPFGKIKGLISDMIEKLSAEAAADATHKTYCDKQLSETKEKKSEKTTEVEKLSTKIDQMTAKSSSLKEEVAALQQALSELYSSQAQMDKLRSDENAVYKSSKADMEQGLSGVQMALKVLNDYYAKDAAHGSASGSSSGIIGLLEVVESDFSKNLAEIVSTEEAVAAAYEQETKDNAVEKTMKEKDVEHKVKESAYLDKESAALSADRSNVQAELDAILEYLSKIQAECTEVAGTYADKKARREAEITGLKAALDTLESETALVQRHAVHRRFRGSGIIAA